MIRVGLLHPGAMGASLAQALVDAGHEACWVSAGRGPATLRRAESFTDLGTLQDMVAQVDVIVSICPPDAALEVAQTVTQLAFNGIYVDANAISPQSARAVAELVGPNYVDGGVVGPPAHKAGTTRLYLSGARAQEVAALFATSLVDAPVVTGDLCAASALKMAYAAYTKGNSALLLAVNALAEQAGVRDTLLEEWALSQPELARRSELVARATAPKAWRFVGEMQEIAATFEHLDLPGDFHAGAQEIYARMSDLQDSETDTTLADVLALINQTFSQSD